MDNFSTESDLYADTLAMAIQQFSATEKFNADPEALLLTDLSQTMVVAPEDVMGY
jgi:hypothetical protein